MIEVKTVKAWLPGEHPDEFTLGVETQRGEQYIAEEVRLRTLKNKVTYTGYREGTVWLRPSPGSE